MSDRSPTGPALEAIPDQVKHRIIKRLQKDQLEAVRSMDSHQLRDLVEQGCSNASELNIFGEDEMYRFIALQFLPREFLHLPLIQSVLIRVLNNLDLPASTRLDFLESQVVRRLTGTSALDKRQNNFK